MNWVRFVAERSRTTGTLRVDAVAKELGLSELVVYQALTRQERNGLVEHLGKKIFLIRNARDTSRRELVNELRPESYLSLETVLRESGISTQTPKFLTCVTIGEAGGFRSKSFGILYRHISPKLFWGFQQKRTLYGSYKVAEPEKALLDWIYLLRQRGLPAATDEFDISGVDRGKLLDYANRYPKPVRQQITELLADFAAGRSGSLT